MKILSLIILSLFITKGCNSEQESDLKSGIIEYTANTRGFYEKIIIKNQTITVSKDRKGITAPSVTKIADSDWHVLIALFKEINLEELPNLKAPTEKRFYDGAAIANFKVTYKDKTYESISFDHGFPPEEVAAFINKINSLVPNEE